MLVPFLLTAVAVGLDRNIDIHTLGWLPDNPTHKKEYKKRQNMLKAASRPQGKKDAGIEPAAPTQYDKQDLRLPAQIIPQFFLKSLFTILFIIKSQTISSSNNRHFYWPSGNRQGCLGCEDCMLFVIILVCLNTLDLHICFFFCCICLKLGTNF